MTKNIIKRISSLRSTIAMDVGSSTMDLINELIKLEVNNRIETLLIITNEKLSNK